MREAGVQAKGAGGVIVCLMPTYGRKPAILNNSLACFFAQTHADKHLVIFDDLGTLKDCQVDATYGEHVTILSTETRSASVGAKYNEMLRVLGMHDFTYDAVAVWDDDDVYLHGYLTTHAKSLNGAFWSKPSSIISAYFDPPKIESAAGRFHGSIALARDFVKFLKNKHGEAWIDTTRATFDQEFISRCAANGTPGDPCEIAPPQYVYRWQTTKAGHCSGLMGSDSWYRDYKPDSREPIARLWPEFDSDTLRTMEGRAQKPRR
jgi:hypothetical protein